MNGFSSSLGRTPSEAYFASRSHRFHPYKPFGGRLRALLKKYKNTVENEESTEMETTFNHDVDPNAPLDMPHRKFPAPLTGHDLMAMFPPAPPQMIEMRAGSTSGFFQRQERAFFAQAGCEIVRVVEVNVQKADVDSRGRDASLQFSASALYQNPPVPRPPMGVAPNTSTLLYPTLSQHPPNLNPPTSPEESFQGGIKCELIQDEYGQDDAWRHPIPCSERRRAGKHTYSRVIVPGS
ncbi:hypothetical protein C0993_008323 [Termitomyces sp. T159_Od127]|nr:hypothetical protein C0993_008323 [Termitomyces sp. T159_Od127]